MVMLHYMVLYKSGNSKGYKLCIETMMRLRICARICCVLNGPDVCCTHTVQYVFVSFFFLFYMEHISDCLKNPNVLFQRILFIG